MGTTNLNNKTAIIIGSGVAGLATAIRLVVQGYTVTVYEKNNYPGGKLSSFKKNGFSFDAGPSLFTQPKNIEELFALAGEPMENYFTYRPVQIACKYFYENGKVVQAFTNPQSFAKELEEKLGEPADAVKNYLQQSKKVYGAVANIFLNHSLHKTKTWLHKRVFKGLAAIKYSHLFKSLHQYNSSKFTSAEAVQLFNRYATYNGSNPYKAPGMLSLIPHLEYNEGVFFPDGGMISITNALYNLAVKKGVQFYFDTPVQKIIHHQAKAIGVVANNENVKADVVVSNMDVYFTYKHLMGNEGKAKQILKQERSSSALVFYWGMKKEFASLELHNIFFTNNYAAEFDCLFKKKTLYNDPTVYVNITAKMQTGLAPHEKENWFVMVNAPANTGQNWATIQQQARKIIIEKLNRILKMDIEPFIEMEEVLQPVHIEEKTASYQGSLYGTSSNSKLAAFFRHPNFAGAIKNLYFCGGSVHPGGGIPLCLKSAKIVSELIQPKKAIIKNNTPPSNKPSPFLPLPIAIGTGGEIEGAATRTERFSKNQIATAIAILFHAIGLVGMLFFKNGFILQLTPVNLLVMFGLLIWAQKGKNYFFWIFLLLVVATGIAVEIIGVNTRLLFGNYSYGSALGFKVANVPLVIGVNWFIIIYCSGISMQTLLMKAINKVATETATPPMALKALSVIVDGATLAVFFDWLMEPVAVQLGYWKWKGEIPLYNYLCWFVIAMALLTLFHFCKFNKQNKFAVHLLLIQIMFFLLLRTFLQP
jgi:phytoene desaturase